MSKARTIASTVLAACIAAVALAGGCGAPKLQAAKDFKLTDTAGKSWTLSDFKGKSPVLIHFGTTWCPPCIEEIPDMKALAKKHSDLVILAVDSNEKDDVVRNFVTGNKIEYPVLLDSDGKVLTDYAIVAVPQNVLVDKDGTVVAQTPDIPEKAIGWLLGK
jgi:peroxiredoxin